MTLLLDTHAFLWFWWDNPQLSEKVGRNKRSVSGMDARAGNGLRPYPGLRQPVCLLAQMKTDVSSIWGNAYLVTTP